MMAAWNLGFCSMGAGPRKSLGKIQGRLGPFQCMEVVENGPERGTRREGAAKVLGRREQRQADQCTEHPAFPQRAQAEQPPQASETASLRRGLGQGKRELVLGRGQRTSLALQPLPCPHPPPRVSRSSLAMLCPPVIKNNESPTWP